MPGPPPKPVEQKRREGNPGKRALPDSLIVAGRGVPDKPESLTETAAVIWDEIVPQLETWGMLDRIDGLALEALCFQAALMREAMSTIKAEGTTSTGSTGQIREHPAIKTFQNAQNELRKWSERFGMDPSSRTRLGLAALKGKSLKDELDSKLGDLPTVDV
jgi:P27 family predicted phage terminase small subunit